VVLYIFAVVVSAFLRPEETAFDRLLNLGPQVRIAIGVFAVVTAPFVEEIVYRGVMYPAAARTFGRFGGIAVVAGLFLAVHFQQYDGSIAHLLPLGLLSLVLTVFRAYSGSVLPSYALHLLFNAFQVALMLLVQQQ
jgi:membrane protease YdiL (CAAX protease family)